MALSQEGFLVIEGSWEWLAFYQCLFTALPLAQSTSIYSFLECLFLCCVEPLSILVFFEYLSPFRIAFFRFLSFPRLSSVSPELIFSQGAKQQGESEVWGTLKS